MNESIVLEGEEKFIVISKSGRKWAGAHCSRVVVYDNLTTRRIVGWLNGHQIIDTGIQDKIDRIEYSFLSLKDANAKSFIITELLGHRLLQLNRLLSDELEYKCNCGKWIFTGNKDAIMFFIEHVDSMQSLLKGD